MSKRSNVKALSVIDQRACGGCCSSPQPDLSVGLSRRHFLQGVGTVGVVMGGLAVGGANVWAATAQPVPADQPFPRGAALRIKPILVYDVPSRGDRTSWRGYGAIHTPEAAREEAGRIENELRQLQQAGRVPHPGAAYRVARLTKPNSDR